MERSRIDVMVVNVFVRKIEGCMKMLLAMSKILGLLEMCIDCQYTYHL